MERKIVVWIVGSEYFLKSRSQQDRKNYFKLYLTWADSLTCERQSKAPERTRTVLSLDDGRLHLVQILLHSQLLVFDHFLLFVNGFLYLLTHDLWGRTTGYESGGRVIDTRAMRRAAGLAFFFSASCWSFTIFFSLSLAAAFLTSSSWLLIRRSRRSSSTWGTGRTALDQHMRLRLPVLG